MSNNIEDTHLNREDKDFVQMIRKLRSESDENAQTLVRSDRPNSTTLPAIKKSEPSNIIHGIQQNHLDNNEKSHLDFFNGTFAERITAAISEAVGVVTLTVGQSGGGTLKGRFVSGYGTLPDNSTIVLTVGTDTSPQVNYIYVLQSDPTSLVKSTSDWPWTVDHIKITRIFCPSAAFVESKGVYSFHLWNDENDDTIFQGHMSHMTDRERLAGAIWDTGVAGAGTSGYLTPTVNNVELKANAGVVYQMHRHDIPAFDTTGAGDTVLVKNWNGTAYHDITNLYDIVADSGGNAIGATKWFKITIWGVANLGTSSFHPIILNLPSGFYNTQAACELDADGHGDVVIPTEFRGTGYLIASIVIQRAATWVIGSTKVLLGQTPTTIGGGGARYTDAEVEAYVSGVANAGIATGDSLVFTDAGSSGVLKQDLVSDLLALAAAHNHPLGHLFFPANGATLGATRGGVVIFPAADTDCFAEGNILIPDDWGQTTGDLIILFRHSATGGYSGQWFVQSKAIGESAIAWNILSADTNNDFPSTTVDILAILTISLTGLAAGDSLRFNFTSDASNTPIMYWYGVWLEP